MKTTGRFKIKDRQLEDNYAEDTTVNIFLQHRHPVKRQTVISGKINSSGYPDFLTINQDKIDIATNNDEEPLLITFADGFDIYGEKDWISRVGVTLGAWSNFEANKKYYLYIDLDDDDGNITFGKTITPPQYGNSFNPDLNSLLHFNGAVGSTNFIDEYGHGWTLGATTATIGLSTAQVMFGSTSLFFNGIANNYIYNNNLRVGDAEAFTIELFTYPTVSGDYGIFSTRGLYGLVLFYRVVTGGLGLYVYMSTNGSSWTTNNIRAGTATVLLNTWNHICIEFDGTTTYFYINGNHVHNIVGKIYMQPYGINIGAFHDNTLPFNGYIDEFRYTRGRCRYNVKTGNFIPPNTELPKDNDLHFFSIPKMKMYVGSGLENFITKKRVFVGETIINTNNNNPLSVINYSFNGKYISPITNITGAANNIIATINDNLGVNMYLKNIKFITRQVGSFGWTTQQKFWANAYCGITPAVINRNQINIHSGAVNLGSPTMSSPASFVSAPSTVAELITIIEREF